MYGLTRGTLTLIGVAVAGFLLWLATRFGFDGSTAEYWATVGLLAGAGLAIALSQLLGGWTKWGVPRISAAVFLLGFLPALAVGGLVLLASQPDGATMQATAAGWVNDLGLGWLLGDIVAMLPVVAFALGLVFGLTFDTTGPRVDDEDVDVVHAHPHDRVADEPVTAERHEVVEEEHRVEEEYREPDRDFVDSLSGRDEPVRRRDGEVEVRDGGRTVAPGDRD
jgi:hypothetical protein